MKKIRRQLRLKRKRNQNSRPSGKQTTTIVFIGILTILSFCFSQQNILSSKIYKHSYVDTTTKNSFRLEIERSVFKKEDHDLSQIGKDIIDGSFAYGIDGNTPYYEISRFNIWINSKKIPVPMKYYKYYFNPNLESADDWNGDGYLTSNFTSDQSGVIILMNGSDAAGSYGVIWIISKDGNVYNYASPLLSFVFVY